MWESQQAEGAGSPGVVMGKKTSPETDLESVVQCLGASILSSIKTNKQIGAQMSPHPIGRYWASLREFP